jgi:hypothetical protein
MRGNYLTGLFITSIAAVALLAGSTARAGLPVTNAYDDADAGSYGTLPNHGYSTINGGFGYNLWTQDTSAGGGGTYMEGPGVNNRGVTNSATEYSFALYGGGGAGTFALSRPLTTPIAGVGEFDIFSRFDIAGVGPNLINIRTGNDTNGFGNGELLSFGIVNSNVLSYTDGSGFHTMNSGESRGSVFSWAVDFNTTAGTYTLSVTNLSSTFQATVSGSLEAVGASVGSFAVINSSGSGGGNQNLIYDDPTFTTVPEPSTIALVGISLLGVWTFRRRKH